MPTKTYVQMGIVAAPHGAIVSVEHSEGGFVVIGIEALPMNVAKLAARVGELILERFDSQLVVDGRQIGGSLWDVLVGEERLVRDRVASRREAPDGAPRAWLYEGLGIERQGLVNELVTADAIGAIHMEHGLANLEAMRQALVSYNPIVREDGEFGSELVVALCLGLLPRLTQVKHQAWLV